MEGENMSFANAFVLLGFSDHPWLEVPLFGIVLVCCILTLIGNSAIILLTLMDSKLQTPMYFFLDNLSVLDLCVTITIVPQLLFNLWGPKKTIAYWSCMTQAYLFHWTGCTECALLAVMAYDRYVAICRPLQYTLIMRSHVCIQLAVAAWSTGLVNSLIQATLTLQLHRCGHHTLNHFFCEVPELIKLACEDTTANDLCLTVGAIPFVLVAPFLVLISYTFIVRAILKLPSAEGRRKAFGTCSSHMVVIIMYYGPAIYMYLQPPANSTQAKFMSFCYVVITPLLNPLIYTLRNKDVKQALRRILQSQRGLKS
ncbi:olfactory receptor 2G3-like [Tenrec ecaudatus]|uniref:olfactory receptor 2G3-like n=1 Tax=Tenrec ecaudatus TaxID=94439 RepID=UPI003F5AB5ED